MSKKQITRRSFAAKQIVLRPESIPSSLTAQNQSQS